MEWTEQEKKIIEKVNFYKTNEITAHVFVVPKPKFKNGLFVSNLEPGKFFWFIERDSSIPIRLFLNEIYDIEDYIEKVESPDKTFDKIIDKAEKRDMGVGK